MSPPVFLRLDEVLAMHADQIRRYGGRPGIRDLELLESALGAPEASYGGDYLHPTLHEMAAAYLFHIVRNHPFVDGNKRIAAALFLWFLDHNNALYFDGHKRIDESALVAITLLIAESKAGEKDPITRLVASLLLPEGA